MLSLSLSVSFALACESFVPVTRFAFVASFINKDKQLSTILSGSRSLFALAGRPISLSSAGATGSAGSIDSLNWIGLSLLVGFGCLHCLTAQ